MTGRLQLQNILIRFISDNEEIIKSLETAINLVIEETENYEWNIKCMEKEIGDRSNMIENAKYFLKLQEACYKNKN